MKLHRAFTLIEMMISVALFSVVMLITATAYLNLVNIDRQTRATNDAVNTLSFALDSMSRAMRTGTKYCNTGVPCSSNTFSFYDTNGCIVTYYLSSAQVLENESGSNPGCVVHPSIPVTDTKTAINSLVFVTQGTGAGDGFQPRVIIYLKGTIAANLKTPLTFSFETMATQRNLDL